MPGLAAGAVARLFSTRRFSRCAREAALVAQMLRAYGAVTQAMIEAGALQASEALQPTSTATTVRVHDGKTMTTDGPFAETKEQLGGFYLVEAADLDAAIAWAAKIPGAKQV